MATVVLALCPACGFVDATPWYQDGRWRVVRCPHCRLGITWPRPTQMELEAFYGENYYGERGMGDQAAAVWPGRTARLLSLLTIAPRRVLDIGAGQGHFVASLRRLGLEAEGVEPLTLGREAAGRIYGIHLLDVLPDSGAFDLVTLIHSLEHVPDPLTALQAAAQRLREGGQLLIEVPHAGSFEMFRPGRRRFIMSLPGHLHHFTPTNLAMLLKKAGMKTVCVDVRNPDVLEWLLARRADLKRFVGARAGAPSVEAESVTRSSRAGYSRRVWCNAVLPFLRTRFPGWSFAMVACRAASNDLETASSTA